MEPAGTVEIELSEGSEADLHRHLTKCKKNPGHSEFIPIDKFNINHLPERHRDSDLYDVIQSVADLTVRINVEMVSVNRPKLWPNSNVPYPLYQLRGKTNCRTGTGMVCSVEQYTTGCSKNGRKHLMEYKTCRCSTCQQADVPSSVWWDVVVKTAAHVVFDKTEAQHSACRLFYDSQDSPCVILDNLSYATSSLNIEEDWCNVSYMTCDTKLADKLQQLVQQFDNNWRRVRDKYWISRDEIKLNFIVSHPHGCTKQVSIGHWVDKQSVGENIYRFTYTTCTCPGSSGAKIFCIGYFGMGWYQPTHRGALESGINYSGSGHVV
ncbi:hypothetical protein BgiMline_020482 [Biomphalaria glabrata]|uniref:Uncharacterized protein LOC129928060 n=1 Tax=Biomphalaria glabrata TaxID=6526 RepID=A0A9W3B9P3_BIOGL|nr:uncharacterized protein LOC129928060 [Biomphalaria glabrata]XP_055896171.1 uncharacterized protein LOC129928060 [Biomphalaria glabrata]XP_055896172.1 uncharacterized protein LOC129928060 [Biomphalaria glabrata]XP_055896173.1 uncharacterized protein LOC129928060 [Biomphalaria glabrata]KAI8748258.1 hypothetical protein BgiMline_017690 [Biomphalaria glabrata]KAI8779168.1 hypothetical protein BgiBS90_020150 [Biomphalaria glabrata]